MGTPYHRQGRIILETNVLDENIDSHRVLIVLLVDRQRLFI